jgi:hypothetical protein
VKLTTQQVVVFLFTGLDIFVNMWSLSFSAAAKERRKKQTHKQRISIPSQYSWNQKSYSSLLCTVSEFTGPGRLSSGHLVRLFFG